MEARDLFARSPRQEEDKGREVVITNCVSTDTTWAVREIAATQWLNTRAKSARTYHLIISLRAGANPARYAHINPYGKYRFNVEGEFNRKGLRPLRQPDSAAA